MSPSHKYLMTNNGKLRKRFSITMHILCVENILLIAVVVDLEVRKRAIEEIICTRKQVREQPDRIRQFKTPKQLNFDALSYYENLDIQFVP